MLRHFIDLLDFSVEDARSKVYTLKGKGGEALAQTFRERKAQKAKHGKTVDEIIEELS